MKRHFLYLLLLLLPLLVACGGDDVLDVLKEQIKWPDSITLHVGESVDFLNEASYYSDNDFVLTSSYEMEYGVGVVYRVVGWHVGTATIYAASDTLRVHEIKVTVLGNYDCFPDPVVDWLSSIEHVKAEHQGGELFLETEPDEENPFYIVAYKGFGKADYIAYLFDAEKKQLIGASVYVKTDDWYEVKKHLQERFKLVKDGDIYGLAGVNTASIVSPYPYVEYKEVQGKGEWVYVFTGEPSDVLMDGDYTVSFISRLIKDNIVEITYYPNWNKME